MCVTAVSRLFVGVFVYGSRELTAEHPACYNSRCSLFVRSTPAALDALQVSLAHALPPQTSCLPN